MQQRCGGWWSWTPDPHNVVVSCPWRHPGGPCTHLGDLCLSFSCSCWVFLLPPPSPSLGHRSLSQPVPALLLAAEGQQ